MLRCLTLMPLLDLDIVAIAYICEHIYNYIDDDVCAKCAIVPYLQINVGEPHLPVSFGGRG